MFIHIGDDVTISDREIIAILDYQLHDYSSFQQFIELNEHKIFYTSQDTEYKSIILTDRGIYFSPLAASTLKGRANPIIDLDSFIDE